MSPIVGDKTVSPQGDTVAHGSNWALDLTDAQLSVRDAD